MRRGLTSLPDSHVYRDLSKTLRSSVAEEFDLPLKRPSRQTWAIENHSSSCQRSPSWGAVLLFHTMCSTGSVFLAPSDAEWALRLRERAGRRLPTEAAARGASASCRDSTCRPPGAGERHWQVPREGALTSHPGRCLATLRVPPKPLQVLR